MKRQSTDGEKLFATRKTDKVLEFTSRTSTNARKTSLLVGSWAKSQVCGVRETEAASG